MSELPLFPLQTVLLPDGLLALRVFETRYVDMVARCLRGANRFGVVAIREGAEVILALGFQSPLPGRVKSVSRYAFYINSLMTNNLLNSNFAFHNAVHHAEILSIFPEFERSIRLFDTHEIPYVIEQGEKAMRAQLDYLKRLLDS